ncbi:hypothetical protein [Roseateles sp.]|nr:hypothetical protein [Roseateles sp.]
MRTDLDDRALAPCTRHAAAALRDADRPVGRTEMLVTPEQLDAL